MNLPRHHPEFTYAFNSPRPTREPHTPAGLSELASSRHSQPRACSKEMRPRGRMAGITPTQQPCHPKCGLLVDQRCFDGESRQTSRVFAGNPRLPDLPLGHEEGGGEHFTEAAAGRLALLAPR